MRINETKDNNTLLTSDVEFTRLRTYAMLETYTSAAATTGTWTEKRSISSRLAPLAESYHSLCD